LPGVSIKSPELNALHISQIQGMVNLNGERSKPVIRRSLLPLSIPSGKLHVASLRRLSRDVGAQEVAQKPVGEAGAGMPSSRHN
jgi:hypothetical protein